MLGRSGRTRALTLVTGLVATATAVGVAGVASGTVAADGPNVGTPWVVTVGDSAISGEAGRWAGNTNQSSSSRGDASFSTGAALRRARSVPTKSRQSVPQGNA